MTTLVWAGLIIISIGSGVLIQFISNQFDNTINKSKPKKKSKNNKKGKK